MTSYLLFFLLPKVSSQPESLQTFNLLTAVVSENIGIHLSVLQSDNIPSFQKFVRVFVQVLVNLDLYLAEVYVQPRVHTVSLESFFWALLERRSVLSVVVRVRRNFQSVNLLGQVHGHEAAHLGVEDQAVVLIHNLVSHLLVLVP